MGPRTVLTDWIAAQQSKPASAASASSDASSSAERKAVSDDLAQADCKLIPLEADNTNAQAEFWQVEKEFKAALNHHIEV